MLRSRCLIIAIASSLLSTLGPQRSAASATAVRDAMQALIHAGEITGAATLVIDAEQRWHLETVGLADVATQRPIQADTIF